MADQSVVPLMCQVEGCGKEATIKHGGDFWCSDHAGPYLTERGILHPVEEQVSMVPIQQPGATEIVGKPFDLDQVGAAVRGDSPS